MKKIVWFLYILAAVYVVRYEIGQPSYIDIHKYAMGQERAPFQQRALLVPVERWAINSPLLAKITGYKERPSSPPFRMEMVCATKVGADMTGCKIQYLEPARPNALHDPANIPIVIVNFLSLIVAAWCAVRLYSKVSPDGRLWFLIPAMVIYAVLVTNLRGTYLYDLPSMALFSLGVVCIWEDRLTLFSAVFIVACLNRETAIMLVPLLLLRSLLFTQLKNRLTYWAWTFFVVITWLDIRWMLNRSLPGVGSELASNLMQNLRSIANPTHWPVLLLTLGGLWLPIALGWRFIEDRKLRWFLWIYPAWLVPMMIRGVITESRIFGELLPFTIVVALVIFEKWYVQEKEISPQFHYEKQEAVGV